MEAWCFRLSDGSVVRSDRLVPFIVRQITSLLHFYVSWQRGVMSRHPLSCRPPMIYAISGLRLRNRVMIEALQNHTPQTIVVDEISNSLEAKACMDIKAR